MRLTIDTGGPARVEVRDAQGQQFQPADALLDHTVGEWPSLPGYYQGHFVTTGTDTLELPAGQYRVIVEKGLEFQRLDRVVDLTTCDRELTAAPTRWAHAAADGWWSADFHLHRPVADARALLLAEDLNLGVFITTWNDRDHWENIVPPDDPVITIDSDHVATLLNAEDERGGGAWILHNLARPLAFGQLDRWYPHGATFVEPARAAGAWFDCEKPVWWEAPVLAAQTGFDSMGVLNNHYVQYGMNADEAWGRPRDTDRYPGARGFSDYALDLYYRYLNLGHRLPASAGSASGVLPAPPGYNRVYVRLPEGLSVSGFYAALRAGRGFVTNGPLLDFRVDGESAGDTVSVRSGTPVQVTATATAREPIDRIQLVANGRIVADQVGGHLEAELDLGGYSWLIARCYLATDWTEPTATVRLAHTSPVYLAGDVPGWDASEDRAYFSRWIDDLIAETIAEPHRFATFAQRDEVLAIYRSAREHYVGPRR